MSNDNNNPQNTSERRVTPVSNNKSSSSSSKTRRIVKKLGHLIAEYEKGERKSVNVPILAHDAEHLIAALQSANEKIMTQAGELNLTMQRYGSMRATCVDLQLQAKVHLDERAERAQEDKDDAAYERIRLVAKVTNIRACCSYALSEAQNGYVYFDIVYWEYIPWDSELLDGYYARALTTDHIAQRVKYYFEKHGYATGDYHCYRVDVSSQPLEYTKTTTLGELEDKVKEYDAAHNWVTPEYWTPSHGLYVLNGGKHHEHPVSAL